MSKYENSEDFKFHSEPRRKELASIVEYINKLSPWSLFQHARLLSMQQMALRGETLAEIIRVHCLDEMQAKMLFQAHPPHVEVVTIVPRKKEERVAEETEKELALAEARRVVCRIEHPNHVAMSGMNLAPDGTPGKTPSQLTLNMDGDFTIETLKALVLLMEEKEREKT